MPFVSVYRWVEPCRIVVEFYQREVLFRRGYCRGVYTLCMWMVWAGVLLVIYGFTGLSTAVKFIPSPLIISLTNGITVLIASTKVKKLIGLHLDKVPDVFSLRMQALAANFHTLS